MLERKKRERRKRRREETMLDGRLIQLLNLQTDRTRQKREREKESEREVIDESNSVAGTHREAIKCQFD